MGGVEAGRSETARRLGKRGVEAEAKSFCSIACSKGGASDSAGDSGGDDEERGSLGGELIVTVSAGKEAKVDDVATCVFVGEIPCEQNSFLFQRYVLKPEVAQISQSSLSFSRVDVNSGGAG